MDKKAMVDARVLSILEDILEELHDGISITDGQGTILRIGETCKTLYGISDEDYVGKHISVLEDTGIFSPSVALRVMEEKKKVTLTQPDKHGQRLLVTGIPIFDTETGEILYIISYASWNSANVRELQSHYDQLQKEIRRSNLELQSIRKNSQNAEIIAASPKMQRAKQLAEKVAGLELPILIHGEPGTGKSLLARFIHKNSPRAGQPFVQMSCSAFSGQILDSELFGYVKINQATGEESEKIGLCEVADSGTLLLEDIECMSPESQGALLYLINNGCYFKTNSQEIKQVDVRIIASTKSSLGERVRQGLFNEELFYRLNVAFIQMPSLQERLQDIPELAEQFVQEANQKHHSSTSLSPQVLELFQQHTWPGNVQELKYLVEQLVFTVGEGQIQSYHLPGNISPFSSSHYEAQLDLKEYLDYYEGKLILQAYERCKTTVKLAKYLGISQASAVRKLQKYLKNEDGKGKEAPRPPKKTQK